MSLISNIFAAFNATAAATAATTTADNTEIK